MMGRLSIKFTPLFHDQPHILRITLFKIKIKQLDDLKFEILVSQKKYYVNFYFRKYLGDTGISIC